MIAWLRRRPHISRLGRRRRRAEHALPLLPAHVAIALALSHRRRPLTRTLMRPLQCRI